MASSLLAASPLADISSLSAPHIPGDRMPSRSHSPPPPPNQPPPSLSPPPPASSTPSRSPSPRRSPRSSSPIPPVIDSIVTNPTPSLSPLLDVPFEHTRVLSVSERLIRSPRVLRTPSHPHPARAYDEEWHEEGEPPVTPTPDEHKHDDAADRETLRAALRDTDLRRRRPPLPDTSPTETVITERTTVVKEEGGVTTAAVSLDRTTITSGGASVKVEQLTESAPASRPSSPGRRPSLSRLFSLKTTGLLLGALSRRGSLLFARSTALSDEDESREWVHRRMAGDGVDEGSGTASLPIESSSLSNPHLPLHSRVWGFVRVRVFPPLLVLLVLMQLILLPVRLALSAQLEQAWLDDRVLDVLYVVGVLVTDYLDIDLPSKAKAGAAEGERESGFRVRLRAGALRRMMVLDLVSTLPYTVLVPQSTVRSLFADPVHATAVRVEALLHLPRLLRLPRLSSFIEQVELHNLISSTVDPTVFRLASFGIYLFLFAHLTGCAWLAVSYMEGLPSDSEWVVSETVRAGSSTALYIHGLYVGFSSMTGNAPSPSTTLEHVLTLAVLFLGVSVYGLLIGNLTAIIQNLNSRSDDFRGKMAAVTDLMQENDLPLDVQLRVRSCMQYLYGYHKPDGDSAGERHRGKDGWAVLDVLPTYLRHEVLCFINVRAHPRTRSPAVLLLLLPGAHHSSVRARVCCRAISCGRCRCSATAATGSCGRWCLS